MTAHPSHLAGGFIASSGDDSEAMDAVAAYELTALISGSGTITIPLNGGSDTRRDVRECWQQRCELLGVPFRAIGGHTLVIGRGAVQPLSGP